MASPANELPAVTRTADLEELLGYVHTSWDNERRSLSRQMHDSLGSSLTALTMHLTLLTAKLPKEPALLDRAAQMKTLLLTIIETNRQMQHRMWNDKLEFLGVRVAMEELVTQFGAEHGVKAVCSLPDEEPACPPSHTVVLLRVLEEGLRNVAAHAHASEVEVVVDDNDDAIMLTLKDDGIGLGHAHGVTADPGKHGLRMMRERVGYLGGRMQLSANGGQGTVLTVTLPKPALP